MNKLFFFLLLPLLLFGEVVTFTPPTGWKEVDVENRPKELKSLIVGKGAYAFPPSINLTMEPFNGSLEEYVAIVKNINKSEGTDWKALGPLNTPAGTGSLSQTEFLTEHGKVRMLHLILKHNDTIYILTCASLAKEFPKFYSDFFKSLRSINIGE